MKPSHPPIRKGESLGLGDTTLKVQALLTKGKAKRRAASAPKKRNFASLPLKKARGR